MAQKNVGVDHGWPHQGIGNAYLSAQATSGQTVAGMPAGAQVSIFPSNGPAGELCRLKTVFIASGDVTEGQFIISVSASGSGSPGGDESFVYVFNVKH